MHDFSAIDMVIKTKQMFFSRVSEERAVKAQPYSGKGGGEQPLHLKRHWDIAFKVFLLLLKIGIFKMI